MKHHFSKTEPTNITQYKIAISGFLPENLHPDILYVDSENLPVGEIFPGIILFNAPESFIPFRVFIQCSSNLFNLLIQDSEQTEIFTAKEIQTGHTCLNLKNGICPPFLPTLNLSCQGNENAGLRVVIEYHKSPLL